METPHHTRRSGLGRRVADIVGGGPDGADPCDAPGGLLTGPVVVAMDVVPFPMLIADSTGRALATNQRWLDLSGLERHGSMGYGWLSVLRPEDRLALRSQVERVAAGDPDLRADYAWLPGGGGRATWCLASHQRAGERVVGIAVGSVRQGAGAAVAEREVGVGVGAAAVAAGDAVAGAGASAGGAVAGAGGDAVAGDPDPVRAELPALLASVRALLETLDRLIEHIAPLEAASVCR